MILNKLCSSTCKMYSCTNELCKPLLHKEVAFVFCCTNSQSTEGKTVADITFKLNELNKYYTHAYVLADIIEQSKIYLVP